MDITLYHKTDQVITFQYYEPDNITKRPLSGATVYFTVKTNKYSTSATDADALITKDITVHTDAINGLTTFTLTKTQTDIKPNTFYQYDIKVKESDGSVYLAQYGKCNLIATPTNRA